MLEQIPKAAGYEVILAADGREGVERHRTSPADLVITDLYMPNQDGAETIRELRSSFPALAIIAMSGVSDTRTTTGDEAHARKLVGQLRQAALDLPFQHVGEIIEFQGDQCDWKKRSDDDPYRWLLIQAGSHLALPVSPSEKRQGVTRHLDVLPQHVIAFETEPGDGCEPANLGLCSFPSHVSHPELGMVETNISGWSWRSFCNNVEFS